MESTEAVSEPALQRATPDAVVPVLVGVELPLEVGVLEAEADGDDEAEAVSLGTAEPEGWAWLWKQPESRNTEAAAIVSRRPFLTRIFVMRTAFRRQLPESTAARHRRRIGARIVMFRTPTRRTRYLDTEDFGERLRKKAAPPSPSPATPAIRPAQLRACEPSSITEAACSVEIDAAM